MACRLQLLDGKGSCMFVHSFCVVVHVHDVVFRDSKPLIFSWIAKCDDESVSFVHTYSLQGNNIGIEGAQALGGGLQHCTNLQELKLVMCVLT